MKKKLIKRNIITSIAAHTFHGQNLAQAWDQCTISIVNAKRSQPAPSVIASIAAHTFHGHNLA